MRYYNYDYLRVIAMLGIVLLHVSATYMHGITDSSIFGHRYEGDYWYIAIANTLPRFAVPIFFMLSGAFLLERKIVSIREFYARRWRKIGMYTALFTLAYFLYAFAKQSVNVLFRGGDIWLLVNPVEDLLRGQAFYHLWFMYVLMGLYLLTPVMVWIKTQLSEEVFTRLGVGGSILASISFNTSTHLLIWDVGYVLYFLAFFFLGHILRVKAGAHKNTKVHFTLFILLGGALETAVGYAVGCREAAGLSFHDTAHNLSEPLSPLIMLASCAIFYGFGIMQCHKSELIDMVSRYSFSIFLFHALVWDVLSLTLVRSHFGQCGDALYVIPLGVVAVFLISLALSILWEKFWKSLDEKLGVTDSSLRLLHLKVADIGGDKNFRT